jgi:hypothetical protein
VDEAGSNDFRQRSAAVPLLFRCFSTTFPQSFPQSETREILGKSISSSQDLGCIFVVNIRSDGVLIFISFFVCDSVVNSGRGRKDKTRKRAKRKREPKSVEKRGAAIHNHH